jgi:hypothetical protein
MLHLKTIFEISDLILVLSPLICVGCCCIPLFLCSTKDKNQEKLNHGILGATGLHEYDIDAGVIFCSPLCT